uniref:mitogen-activated protein kinase kinase kinase 18-like n=1 Tax=Erigeron canadensis TaxID=72917 RepID=UPI001CB8F9DD|nr:mitogen-activated protein kinase kinase kinase 18-like [Erigeron canadensis]
MEWTRGHVLGRGSSATVFAATSTSGDVFAVKSAHFAHSENLKKEQKFLSILKSPYVVSYKGCDITREGNNIIYNIFMDYMSGGSIMDSISVRNGGALSNLEIANYTRQIVKGLEYIHSCGVVHCDIKGTNILVEEKGVKIGDLGCAKWANQASQIHGTPMFMAPEVAQGQEQGFPADIWALGCTMIEMATGDLPWSNVDDPVSLLYKIAFCNEIPNIPNELCDQGKDFLSKCFVRDPRQRWTAKQLLNHPYIHQQFDDNNSNQTIYKKPINTSTSSPTSVLDQDVWNYIDQEEVPNSSSTLLCIERSSSSSLKIKQRIKQLASSKKSIMSKLECEKEESEKWVTIRMNE